MLRINMLQIEVNKKIDIIICNKQLEKVDSSWKDGLHILNK
jgi:hypothetical protein